MHNETPALTITTDEVDHFEPQIDRLLFALLGHAGALVTDIADVGDFMDWPGRADPDKMEAVEALMGHPVSVNDRLVDLARELAANEAAVAAMRH